ncbi:MAG: RimK family alpha-L-glutamate ligase [Deltaproteobacteria bacterium]|nr:MAG: RimK family alpha-L-glutamate ligase [Deltaproteobacteria bacterium]TNF31828.1 MAG: RimK family alpha-L-glutamate ligase [Deltaproteobacteria bacterium]
MKGWILYKDNVGFLKPSYAVKRLVEESERLGVSLEIINPNRLELTVTREDRKSILLDGEPVALPDFIIPRMGAFTNYFDLAVIRHLERLGVKSFNSSESVETVKDKLYSQQILAERGLPVPKTMLVKFPVNVDLVEKRLGFPVVVKTLYGSQGSGVFLCESKKQFLNLIELVEATKASAHIILQEFISDSKGRDLRVFTIGGRAIACVERKAAEGEFKANFSQGGKVKPFEITPEIEWLAVETSRIFNLDISGIDLLFDGDHFKVCEANSAPGFQAIEQSMDINMPKEIFHFIRIRLGIFQKTEEELKEKDDDCDENQDARH